MDGATSSGLLDQLREICLVLPEAEEKETWGIPTFRIRDKIFAMGFDAAVWCKAPDGVQAMLISAAPDRFFVPPYVGRRGWIGFRLDHVTDWVEATALIRRSYRMTAPKRLAQLVPDAEQGSAPVGQRTLRPRPVR